MIYARRVKNLLRLTDDQAWQVYSEMMARGFKFHDATRAEFNSVANDAFNSIMYESSRG